MNAPWKWLALALAALAAGAAVWALTASAGSSARPPLAAETGDGERLTRIEAQLAELRAAIEDLARRDARPGPGGPVRRDAAAPATDPAEDPAGESARGAEDEAWRLALAALETRLVDELAALRDGLRRDLDRELVPERIRDAGRAIDWGAWEEVVARWHEDPDRARREVKLLTADEVLERFGPPSDVLVNANGLTWQYARPVDPATGVRPLEIILRIPDGYVVQLAVRDRRR